MTKPVHSTFPRLAWTPTTIDGWLEATWEGAGFHDHANIHRIAGLQSGERYRWQETINMETRCGYTFTRQEASDRANEAWREMWKAP